MECGTSRGSLEQWEHFCYFEERTGPAMHEEEGDCTFHVGFLVKEVNVERIISVDSDLGCEVR